MNFADVEAVANAILFEGYILYPYRPSAIKNRQRWNFGTLCPESHAAVQKPPERSGFKTQTLVECDADGGITACVRFLQLFCPLNRDSRWKEGFARTRTVRALKISNLCAGVEYAFDFSQPDEDEQEALPPDFVPRRQFGRLAISATRLDEGLYRLQASFFNESPAGSDGISLEEAQELGFTSAHLLLGVERGSFISLLDPPAEFEAAAKACRQDGVYPVLVGAEESRSRMLCSPIILYDYPQVAPESAGDFFDGTEMDEMLALRVLSLTDEEKAAVRAGDPHARAILERTEALPEEQWMKVHGAVRSLRAIERGEASHTIVPPARALAADPFAERPPVESVRAFGVELHRGDRVRLWPQKKADILDMAMAGQIAIIETIEEDLEDNVHLAVVLEDDPGRDMGMLRQAGHRFFYALDEVEPLREE